MKIVYEPTAKWIQNSHLAKFLLQTASRDYADLLLKSQKNPEWFWEHALKDMGLNFETRYSKLLDQNLPFPSWATGGKISPVENCIDRHCLTDPNKTALIFEADGLNASYSWTYADLARETRYIAAELRKKGAHPGDRAALLMPMSLEMVASFFGILRAGLTVVPIFSGFGIEAIQSRLEDAKAKFIFVQEKTSRRGKEVPVDKVLAELQPRLPFLQHIFILNREDFQRGHVVDVPTTSPGEASYAFDAEAECMLLYTSGTSGKPKGCVHTAFGVLATTGKELRYTFDVHSNDTFFWYTDIGWMMGPWELFGALQYGATVVLYEGVPDYPNPERLWEILEKYGVTIFGISPTAIRLLKKNGDETLKDFGFEHLRILGSTGEPWDEESWTWFFEQVGKRRCPVMNISGGTEIMGCFLSPHPFSPLKPCTLGGPVLGANAQIWNQEGKQLHEGLGHLVCLSPLPSMTKGFLNSKELYLQTYFEKFGKNVWYHGDWALVDAEGFWFLRGRSDDTIKIAGKRVGPNEYESALMEDDRILEVAAVGVPHALKGECVQCFVVLKSTSLNANPIESIRKELLTLVTKTMGKALAPDKIFFVETLPKTRSGKILRGIIRKIVLKQENIDASAVENLKSLDSVRNAL